MSSLKEMPSSIVHPALLASLPQTECDSILTRALPVPLSAGNLLYDACAPLERMYFPATSVVSLPYDRGDGRSAELALVGDEGLVTSASFAPGPTAPRRAVVITSGWACVVCGDAVAAQLGVGLSVPELVRLNNRTLLAQMTQSVLCNASHTEAQRLSRWLLLQFDRIGSDELGVTAQVLACAVGLHPASLGFSLGMLRASGAVHFARDYVSLRDRHALHDQSCRCYRVIKRLAGKRA